ncbi:MAG: GAF and ANTAR domain-containing protein [Acidothermaceae bacterium]
MDDGNLRFGSGGPAGDPAPMDPAEAFSQLGRIVLGEDSLDTVLDRVAQLARGTIPGVAAVSVTLIHGDHANTAAFAGEIANQLDERQYEEGYGPCLDAARTGKVVVVTEMADEQRWPKFSPHAVRHGVRSSLSVGLPVREQVIGALNIYAYAPDNFDADAVELARTFASYAAVALANASLYTSTAELAGQLQQAMESRAAIEQAKGIIMGQLRCDAEAAFAVLIARSQHQNRKLRDIAIEVITAATGGA